MFAKLVQTRNQRSHRLAALRPVQRVDADTGIVRQRRPFRNFARVTCLRQGIFDERRVRLVGIRDSKLALCDDCNAQRLKQAGKFAQLAGIGGGENQARDHALSASFCAAINLRIPRSPSVTSAFICSRVNGAPSAVPCNSTKPPLAVMTIFMSVSQAESSA